MALAGIKLFKILLAFDCLLCRECLLQVDVSKTGKMNHKDGGGHVPALGEPAFELGNETHLS